MRPAILFALGALLLPGVLSGQTVPPLPAVPGAAAGGRFPVAPFSLSGLAPGSLELLQLDTRFAEAVAKGGGKAFASWFADDGVSLSNGKAAVVGRKAIAAVTTWNPKEYQLTWYLEGAQMAPAGDSGFTWGHFDTQEHDKDGKLLTTSGRYFTFWKKVDGAWKVALEASANEGPPVGS